MSKITQKYLRENNKKYPCTLQNIPSSEWPINRPVNIIEVWRSKYFLVQVYKEADNIERLSVCRTEIKNNNQWKENITWDELQAIKAQCGRGNKDAVEIYPCDNDVVNVANIRHLWILPNPLNFAWRRKVTVKKEDVK